MTFYGELFPKAKIFFKRLKENGKERLNIGLHIEQACDDEDDHHFQTFGRWQLGGG